MRIPVDAPAGVGRILQPRCALPAVRRYSPWFQSRSSCAVRRRGRRLRVRRRTRGRAGPAQRHLFRPGRVVQPRRRRVREGNRHQDDDDAQRFGRVDGAARRREGEPEARRLVRRHRRSASAGSRARADRGVQVADDCAAPAMGAKAGRTGQVPHRRHLPRRAGVGLQHRIAGEEEGSRARVLEGSRETRVRERRADGESERVGYRLHGDCDAGAGVRRGRGVQAFEGHAQEHHELRAPGRGARSRRPRVAKTWSRSRSFTTSSPRRKPVFR